MIHPTPTPAAQLRTPSPSQLQANLRRLHEAEYGQSLCTLADHYAKDDPNPRRGQQLRQRALEIASELAEGER